jgi:hypothetical protein
MPDLKISELPAVVTPAATDQFAVNQGGVSRMETRAQIHNLVSGERFVAALGNNAAAPSFGWETANSGFFVFAGTNIGVSVGGLNKFIFGTDIFSGSTGNSGRLRGSTVTGPTVPTILPGNDLTTGIGAVVTTPFALSMVAAGVEGIRLTGESSHVIQAPEAQVGLTADVGSGQGDGVILSSYNEYATVATAGDAATLPDTFIVGTKIYVKNNGANAMDVFPASGDDAGAGADVAIVVSPGDSALFMAIAADATWTQISIPLVQNRLVLPQVNDAANPTLAFGAGTSGFFNPVSTLIGVSIGGTSRWLFAGGDLNGQAGSSAGIRGGTSSSPTVPTLLPSGGDADTGIGSGGATLDQLSLIAGAIEGMRFTEVSDFVLQAPDSNVGLTADPSSVQGGGVILCSYNVYSTVATIGDAATLPAAFKVGTKVWVKNDAANSMDVFPASGDDAGGGVDTAVAVAGGATALFIATVVDATWTQLI